MKKFFLTGFLMFAILLLPRMAFAQSEPTNVKATVSGGDIILTWTAPASLPAGANSYAVFMQTTPIDPIVYPYTSNEGNILQPTSVPLGTTQRTESYLDNRTYYFTVGVGTCVQKDSYCEFSSYGNFSPVSSVILTGGNPVGPLTDPSWPECKNTAGLLHATGCVDMYRDGVYEERHNVFCVKGYTDMAKDGSKLHKCVLTTEAPATAGAAASSTLICTKPKVAYQGQCVNDMIACKNPPAHSSNCIDLIKDGKLVERDMFMCDAGYTKQGNECVNGNGSTSDTSADNEAIDEQEIPEGQADLTIKVAKATLVSRTFKGGVKKKQYKFGVTVKNEGDGDADGPFYVSFANSTKGVPVLVTKGTLEAGKNKKVFVYVETTEKGKKLLFTVDPDNAVYESNEDNNVATRVVGK